MQHGNCGQSSNRSHPKEFRQAVLERVKSRYGDLGPTLAAEPLGEDDGLCVHAETLRRGMGEAGLWRRARRRQPYRQRRERKAHFGELVPSDGSFHEWLEERGRRGGLMHMVDDATRTVSCQFSAEETIWAAVGVLRVWIEYYGVPRALYTDWKNVYGRAATEGEKCEGKVPLTQFGRMCGKLGIRIIAASSPQAKRARGTGAWHPSGPAGEETAAGRGGWLRRCQSLSGRALYRRAQPALRTAGGGGGRPGVLAGGGAGGE